LRINTEFDFSVRQKQNLNPPQSPLVRGDDVALDSASHAISDADAPPLTRGGGEGLPFLPYEKKLTALARENRKNPTAAELKIWREILSRRQFSAYKFLRQKPIEHFIVDFYCAQLRWVIEIDGDSHVAQQCYDEQRSALLRQHGLTVIRYDNREVINNLAGVYDDLVRRIN
jgi:very-short-patch-repair endonuclease